MASNIRVTHVLEQSRVSPQQPTVAELSLPLTLFDMILLIAKPVRGLFFYEFPYPKQHFVEKIIPSLKASLSLTLKHFLPAAGHLLYSCTNENPHNPTLHYKIGDSVPITFAESKEDFHFFKGNHARDAKKFLDFFPELLPLASQSTNKRSKFVSIPLLAVQVTIFPESGGLAIATTNHHVMADGNIITRFMSVWASINKNGDDSEVVAAGSLPTYDRTMIKDPFEIGTIIWNEMKQILVGYQEIENLLVKKEVRATFDLEISAIQKLKNFLLSKKPNVVHASSFVVVCAYAWTCWVKAGAAIGEKMDENSSEILVFPAECRSRLNPQIPDTYFGNCMVFFSAMSPRENLIGNEGFLMAAELIGNEISQRLSNSNKDEFLEDYKNWLMQIGPVINKSSSLTVMGSPKFVVYDVDYGWGKPEKYDNVAFDEKFMSINKSGKSVGGVEIGFVLPHVKMDAFAKIFNDGLRAI